MLSCGSVYYTFYVFPTFEYVDEILKCDHSNESFWAVLSFDSVYYAEQVIRRWNLAVLTFN